MIKRRRTLPVFSALGFLNIADQLRAEGDVDLLIQLQVFDHHRSVDHDLLDLTEEKPFFELFSLIFEKVIRLN